MGDARENRGSSTQSNPEMRTNVLILTANYRIIGNICLIPGARVTDYIVNASAFLAVTDATVMDKTGKELFRTSFLDVQREKIELIMPVELVSEA